MKESWNNNAIDNLKKLERLKVIRAGYEIEREAKIMCPVDTGRLRASITTTVEESEQNIKVKVGTDVNYGPYLEFGTRYMRAKPFLRPAFMIVINKLKGELK